MSKQTNIYENEIEDINEEIIENSDNEEEDIIDEEIDDGDDILDDLEDIIDDMEDYEDPEDIVKDVLLDDLDDMINEIEEEDNKVEEISTKKVTFNILTKYEKNFVLGFRTQQIINGSVILIDIKLLKDKSAYSIAQEELRQKRIPFKIKRTLPNGKIEIWDISELIVL